jgi:hypothetical protein
MVAIRRRRELVARQQETFDLAHGCLRVSPRDRPSRLRLEASLRIQKPFLQERTALLEHGSDLGTPAARRRFDPGHRSPYGLDD